MENNLTDKKFWDDGYKNQLSFFPENIEYPITKKIYEVFDNNFFINKSVFEIGCFPGRFLYHFGKLGFILNGIDQTLYLDSMVSWFKQNNFKLGEFIKDDLFNLKLENKYELVFSSGFIEHFKNFDEVINIHTKLVSKDGYIFITTLNFAGFIQKYLHIFLDSKENFYAHNLKSMDYKKWKNILEKDNFEIIDGGYMGGFDFWIANKNIFARIITKLIRIIFCWRFLPNTRAYSPEIFIIAKKVKFLD